MLQVVLPITLFTTIVLVLSVVVLAARHWLQPRGVFKVDLNGRRTIEVAAGDKLLWALAENGVYLPAACGGRGTCGQCRVTVLDNGTPPLPTEASHISRREAEEGVRLACMTTVRQDLDVVVAEDILEARRRTCSVVSNRNISTLSKELVLDLPEGERMEFAAGDYVLLEVPPHSVKFSEFDIGAEYRDEWQRHGLLQLESNTDERVVRAYSLANPPSDAKRLTLVVRIALPPADAGASVPPGQASSWIFGLQAGDDVTVSGPFGDFHARDSGNEMVFIAGGVGIAPIRSIILDQLGRDSRRKMSFWYGARNGRELCYNSDFDRLASEHENFSWHVALSEPRPDEGWSGYTGLIHTVIHEKYLKDHPAPEEAEYYLCGPPLMSSAVVHMLEDLGVEADNIYFDDFGA